MKIIPALGLLLALTACSSTAPVAESTAPTSATTTQRAVPSANETEQPITGSRLARQTSDRTVKSTSGKTYRQEDATNIRTLGNEIGSK